MMEKERKREKKKSRIERSKNASSIFFCYLTVHSPIEKCLAYHIPNWGVGGEGGGFFLGLKRSSVL